MVRKQNRQQRLNGYDKYHFRTQGFPAVSFLWFAFFPHGEKMIPHIMPPSAFAPRSIFKASVHIVGTFGGGQRLALSPCLVLQLFRPIRSKLHSIYCRSGSGYWLIVHLILSSKTYIKGRQLRPPLMAQQTAVWQRC